MAALTISDSSGPGNKTLTWNTLTASDTFTYVLGDVMIWRNTTGGTLALTVAGAAGALFGIPGYGVLTPTSRVLANIAAGGYGSLHEDDIWQYLQGTVTLTGGSTTQLAIIRR